MVCNNTEVNMYNSIILYCVWLFSVVANIVICILIGATLQQSPYGCMISTTPFQNGFCNFLYIVVSIIIVLTGCQLFCFRRGFRYFVQLLNHVIVSAYVLCASLTTTSTVYLTYYMSEGFGSRVAIVTLLWCQAVLCLVIAALCLRNVFEMSSKS